MKPSTLPGAHAAHAKSRRASALTVIATLSLLGFLLQPAQAAFATTPVPCNQTPPDTCNYAGRYTGGLYGFTAARTTITTPHSDTSLCGDPNNVPCAGSWWVGLTNGNQTVIAQAGISIDTRSPRTNIWYEVVGGPSPTPAAVSVTSSVPYYVGHAYQIYVYVNSPDYITFTFNDQSNGKSKSVNYPVAGHAAGQYAGSEVFIGGERPLHYNFSDRCFYASEFTGHYTGSKTTSRYVNFKYNSVRPGGPGGGTWVTLSDWGSTAGDMTDIQQYNHTLLGETGVMLNGNSDNPFNVYWRARGHNEPVKCL